ncbi:MAG: DUF58 domain-containing protein [Ruminococcaceae bacterium]|nr:DUF58 domain-containing protein [Oscillospiraceae bacterium]
MSIVIFLVLLLVLAWIEKWIYDAHWDDGLNVRISFGTDRSVEGGTAELVEVVEHAGRLPLPWLTVKFQASRDLVMPDSTNASVTDYYYREDIFAISPGERITRRLPVTCAKRGLQTVRAIDLLTNDLLMISRYVGNYSGSAELVVYPRPVDTSELYFEARRFMGEIITKRNLQEDPFVFRGVREYVEGDSIRAINWKATARSDRPVVNQYESTTSLSAAIWLCVETAMDPVVAEESIRIAASVARRLIGDGIPVSLLSNGTDCITHQVTRISSGCSPQHADTVCTALARLDTENNVRRFVSVAADDKTGEEEFVIVIAPYVKPAMVNFVKEVTEAGREVMWIKPVRADEPDGENELEGIANHYIWRVTDER